MSIWQPCYSNRYEVQRALDFAPGVDANAQTDRAMMSAAENIYGQFHRVFYPYDGTRWADWPNQGEWGGGQYADPWKLRLNDNDLVCMTQLQSGGVTIPLTAVFLRPTDNWQKGMPFTHFELDRSQSYTFGNAAQTPQNSISMTGTWGYGADADPAGTLAAEVGTGDSTITVTDGSQAGPGDLVVLGYGRGSTTASAPYAGSIAPYLGERILITDVTAVATGLTQAGSGCTTDETSDIALSTTGTGALNVGEVLVLDQEQLLVEQVVAGVATVRRAFAGTALQDHSGATVYAFRQYSVLRAQLGTSANSYALAAAVVRHRVPQLIRDLSIAESEVQLLNEGSAYARTVGSGESATPAPGVGLMDKWAEARARYGRKGRMRGV